MEGKSAIIYRRDVMAGLAQLGILETLSGYYVDDGGDAVFIVIIVVKKVLF